MFCAPDSLKEANDVGLDVPDGMLDYLRTYTPLIAPLHLTDTTTRQLLFTTQLLRRKGSRQERTREDRAPPSRRSHRLCEARP